MKRYIITVFMVTGVLSLAAQERDFKGEFEAGNFQKSAELIEKKLDDIYNKRTDRKKVPTGFITLKADTRDSDLMEVFRKRRAEGFFIEDNPEISQLHLYAARSYARLNKPDYALNHYAQSLRFKHVVPENDHPVAWEIAQIHKNSGRFRGYIDYLEAAYSMNTAKAEYSLELGKALYPTSSKDKSIYHLRRYVDAVPDHGQPELFLMLGSLYEETGRHLETKKYYAEYLKERPDDPKIHFALGVNANTRTGDLTLAVASFRRAIELLPEDDIFRFSKSHEFIADISMKNLKFQEAVDNYLETVKYQNKILKLVDDKRAEMKGIEAKINEKKSILLREQNFDEYEEYEILRDELAEIETNVKKAEFEYSKLNPGRVRWNLAECHERLKKYDEAISWYRESMKYQHNSNLAREKIIKLQLKIKRGY